MFISPTYGAFRHHRQNRLQIYYFFLRKKFSTKYFLFLWDYFTVLRMTRNTFRIIALTFAVIFGMNLSLWGQEQLPDSLITPVEMLFEEETLPSAEELLKAKVDSLRNALSDSSPARRRQSAARMLATADSLRGQYEFRASADLLRRAAADADSTLSEAIEESLSLSRNGLNMMGYCSRQTVVARQTFPLEDFMLMYPMKEETWRKSPNELDPVGDRISQAIYVPDEADILYYTSTDTDGIRNIYMTQAEDTTWSAPALINEKVTSASDEIYPMVSPDGRTLYFASRGLYGMGGYDLYMSQWNSVTQDWDQPVNMGFPFSSPYDDFLFINTDDGRYSVFASNRGCPADSVNIYVLEYDALPARSAISNERELRELAALNPTGTSARKQDSGQGQTSQDPDSGLYMKKMADVRALRDSVYSFEKEIDGLRALLTDLPQEEQGGHVSIIQVKEMELSSMHARLDQATKDLQGIELEFLSKGVLMNMARTQEEISAADGFAFIRHNFGEAMDMTVSDPAPQPAHEFSIGAEGWFAESSAIPDGIVYQIQLAEVADRLEVEDLHGLGPVFDRMSTSLVHTYSVGIFRTYQDALSNLNSVRKAGFKNAFITANIDGHRVTVDAARAQENSRGK